MQRKLKWPKIIVCAVVTLGLVATSAFGETINLICNCITFENRISYITLDLNAKTAFADSEAPSAAIFNSTEVTWDSGTLDYILNRNTGSLTISGKSNLGNYYINYHCAIGNKLF